MPRRSRAGDTFGGAKGPGSVAAPLGPSTRGSYRDRSRAPGGRGGTLYPTVLEAYNRDSDFKRWLAGARLWEEGRGAWSRRRVTYFIRSFRNFGIATNNQLNTLTLFSSFTSPEGAWATVTRERGAVILLQPLLDADMRLEQQSAGSGPAPAGSGRLQDDQPDPAARVAGVRRGPVRGLGHQ
jgi:hypothetical protein